MDIRQEKGKQPPAPLDEVGLHVAERIEAKRQKWLSDLCEHPEQFRMIESRVHDQCGQIADFGGGVADGRGEQERVVRSKKKSWLRRLIRSTDRLAVVIPGHPSRIESRGSHAIRRRESG